MKGPKVWVNGRRSAAVLATDRGLQYGDGLFETMFLKGGRIRLLTLHVRRLSAGLKRLGMASPPGLWREVGRTAAREGDGVLKLILTRGPGERGYRPSGTEKTTRILIWQRAPIPETTPARVRLCRTPMARNRPLAGLKTLNRLESVLARREWKSPRIFEGLMCDEAGNIISGTMSNLFLRRGRRLITPSLMDCGVDGIMRRFILRTARSLQLRVQVRCVRLADLKGAEEMFMSNALIGARSVGVFESRRLKVRFASAATARALCARLERA